MQCARAHLAPAVVVAVNVLLLSVFCGLYAWGRRAEIVSPDGQATLTLLLLGTLAAEVNLVSIWAVFARGRWLSRLALGAAAITLLALVLSMLDPLAIANPSRIGTVVGACFVQAVAVFGPLSVYRAFGARLDVRVHVSRSTDTEDGVRYALSQLLLAVTVAALLLVCVERLGNLRDTLAAWGGNQQRPMLLTALGLWGACSALFGVVACRVALAEHAGSVLLAVPLAALPACLVFPWLQRDWTAVWQFIAGTFLHVVLLLCSLLVFRAAGYRISTIENRINQRRVGWVALVVFAAPLVLWWHVAGDQRWVAAPSIKLADGYDASALAFSRDMSFVALERFGSENVGDVVELWDLKPRRLRKRCEDASLIGFSRDGRNLLMLDELEDDVIRTWNRVGGQSRCLRVGGKLLGIACTTDNKLVVATQDPEEKQVVVKELPGEKVLGRIEPRFDLVSRVLLSADRHTAAVLCKDTQFDLGATIQLRDLVQGKETACFRVPFFPTGSLSSDGRLFAVYDAMKSEVQIWDVIMGRRRSAVPCPFALPSSLGLGLSFSRDGKTLVAAGAREDDRLLGTLLGQEGPVQCDQLILWDTTTWRPRAKFVLPWIWDWEFSGDDKILAVGSLDEIALLELSK